MTQLNGAQDEWNSRFAEHIRPLYERAIAHELEEFDRGLHLLQASAATCEQYEVAAKQEVPMPAQLCTWLTRARARATLQLERLTRVLTAPVKYRAAQRTS